MARTQASFLFLALGLGMAASLSAPGCLIPDYCIEIYTAGVDWCRGLNDAQMWPSGQPQAAEPILDPEGGGPTGCICFNDAEQQIFTDQAPAVDYDQLRAQLEKAARDKCVSLVPAGFDHDCDTAFAAPEAPGQKSFECKGDCTFVNPPPFKDCPELDPYQCNGEGAGGNDEVGTESDSTDGTDTASDTGVIKPPPGAFIDCAGTTCIIDAEFARTLWDDPSMLADDAVVVFDPTQSRFVFATVEPGMIAHELGLRPGDVLEAIDDAVIDDLDAATRVYRASEDAEAIVVRVGRGARWVDFQLRFED